MLTIGKPTAFGRDGMAVPGQYAPDTPGWNLRWFVDGRETLLYTSTLATCRRFMAAIRGLDDVDAMRRVIDAHLVGETVEMLPLNPVPTEAYPPVDDAPEGEAAEKYDLDPDATVRLRSAHDENGRARRPRRS